MSGYSEKSLIDKLGYISGDTVRVFGAPAWFTQYLQQAGVVVGEHSPIWLHGFFSSVEQFANFLGILEKQSPHKGFWVSWPKKSSGIKSDVTEQTFRDLLLPTGWVDVKVVAIDATWSGLKFVRRKT